MMRSLFCGSFALVVTISAGQWQVPVSVVLDGSDSTDRQVLGLGAPEGGDHGVAVVADRSATTTYGLANGTDELTLTLTPAPASYTPGMRITFTPSGANTGDVSLDANGLGGVPLRKHVNVPLDSGDLRAGVPVQVIYDGSVFQVASQLYPGCPAGYTPVGVNSCIEAVSREPVNWFSATSACVNEGKRLCGFAEWIQACLQGDNIFGTIADYEWVDEAANSTNDAKTMGINATTLLPDCRAGGTRGPLELMRYRCCYDR